MITATLKTGALAALGLTILPAATAAQESPASGRTVMIGVGVQTIPRYPGSADQGTTLLPHVDVWRTGGPMGVETPDESIGVALIGRRGRGVAIGPAVTVAPTREAADLPGLAKVPFGVEAGIFAEAWPIAPLRLHAELRQGIGAHKALTGDLAADLVIRHGNEGPMLTVGPRLRWGSAKHQRAYFGVPGPGAGGLAAYEPGSGLYAVGAAAGVRLPLGRTFGLYGYLGYDRLTGRAADSPVVQQGSPDQYSAGLALTYRFRL